MPSQSPLPITFLIAASLFVMAGGIAARAVKPGLQTYDLQISNQRDVATSISWLTDTPAVGVIRYGATTALGSEAADDRGAAVLSETHHVTIAGLLPGTLYYFDVVSDGEVDDNGGAHYTFRAGPTLGPMPPTTAYGQVLKADGVTPAEGAIVSIIIEDRNGAGTSGRSTILSSLVSDQGYWAQDLSTARRLDLSGAFSYSTGDVLLVSVRGGSMGAAEAEIGITAITPAATIILAGAFTPTPTTTLSATLTPSLTPSSTPTPSVTATPTPSRTPSITPTPVPTETPTASLTPSPSSTPTPTSSLTPSPTPTPLLTATPTSTASPTGSLTLSPTPSPSPSATPTPPLSPTPTSTASQTPSATPSSTPALTSTGTATGVPTATPSRTPTPSATLTPSASPTSTLSGQTLTPTTTPTASRTLIATPTTSPTSTHTPSPTVTHTPSVTASATLSSSPSATPTPGNAVDFLWLKEAESASVPPSMAVEHSDGASACDYVVTVRDWTAEKLSYQVDIPTSGAYYLWARVMGLSWANNSFFVTVDQDTAYHFEIQPAPAGWTWSWQPVHADGMPFAPITLTKGMHQLHFGAREGGARLDAVLLTGDAGLTPNYLAPCPPTHTPTSTLTPSLTRTATATATPTATRTPTRTATASATLTFTPSPSPAATVTPTGTATATPSATPRPTDTPTVSPSPTPSPAATSTCADLFEPDDSPSQAKPLHLNSPQFRIFHRPGDIDMASLFVAAGASLHIYTWVPDSDVDTRLWLLASDGATELAYNDDDPDRQPASSIFWRAPASGVYFVKAASASAGVYGCDVHYMLSVQSLPHHTWLPSVVGGAERSQPLYFFPAEAKR